MEYGENGSGILTTAGHLLITGDISGDLIVLDPATGKTLWHVYVGGRLTGCPMTYLLTAVDSVLYAWALPTDFEPSSRRDPKRESIEVR
jgi:alcohol dehydrogenase (cytochrome c)